MTHQASDEVIEQIWQDLHRLVPRSRVADVTRQVATEFADATVVASIPLFVHRAVCERLLPEATAAAADQGEWTDKRRELATAGSSLAIFQSARDAKSRGR